MDGGLGTPSTTPRRHPPGCDPETLARLGFRPNGLPDLGALGMPPAALLARRKTLNCSEMGVVHRGDPEALNALWAEKRSTAPPEPEPLLRPLNAQAGQFIEPFLLARFEAEHGVEVTRMREGVAARRRPWLRCTLDGFVEDWQGKGRFCVNTKFISPWAKTGELLEAYRPQQMCEGYCTDADGSLLVVYNQGGSLAVYEYEQDPVALDELLSLADEFWGAVRDGRPPRAVPAKEPAAKPPRRVRSGEAEMARNNSWADAAQRWLETRDTRTPEQIKAHAQAANDLKALVPDDKRLAHGHGVQVKANAAGAKSVSLLDAAGPGEEAAP